MLLGAQTYTVRRFTQSPRDFAEAMRRIAAIGYRAVQLSAVGPMEPAFLRETCDRYSLQIVLTHTHPERILNDPEGVVREHQTLGCPYVGIGMLPERYRESAWIDRFALDFAGPARRLREAGLRLMYHNHNFEWERLPDGRRMLDAVLGGLPPELLGVTLDTYWVQAAGCDVLAWIERLQDRIACVHLKDMAVRGFEQRMAPIGDGNIDFAAVLAKLQSLGKTDHLLVEQDECYGEDPFACLERSFRRLHALGYC